MRVAVVGHSVRHERIGVLYGIPPPHVILQAPQARPDMKTAPGAEAGRWIKDVD